MTPKKQSIKTKKSIIQNKIEKFLIKAATENEAYNTDQDEVLKQKIKDLQDKISELLKEKRKLECLKLPKPYKLKDVPLNYDNSKCTDSSYGTHSANLRLKFHEFTGCVASKFHENMFVVKFNVYASNKVHVYGIRLNIQDGIFTYSKCFVPPMIKIKELLHQYSISSNPKPFIKVLATSCQVFHEIQIQIDQFKEKLDSKDVTIFNSFNNRVIILGFKMVQRSTESVFPVSVEFLYDIYKPRPISIIINSKEMPASTLKAFRKQCKNFNRFSLWNAFEIITNMGLKQHESVFYLLKEQSNSAEMIVGNPIIKKKTKSNKVIDQILHDFTFDSNEEDISPQKDESNSSLDRSFSDKSNEISSHIAKTLRKNTTKQENDKVRDFSMLPSRPQLKEQLKINESEESEKSSDENIVKNNSKQSKVLPSRPQLKEKLKINESEESEKSSDENIVQNNSKQSKDERSNASEISLRTKNKKPEKSLSKSSNQNSKELKNGIKRSFDQSFTNAETNDKIKIKKNQTENTFSKVKSNNNSNQNQKSSSKIVVFQENKNLNSQNSPSNDSNDLLNGRKRNVAKSQKSIQISKPATRAQTMNKNNRENDKEIKNENDKKVNKNQIGKVKGEKSKKLKKQNYQRCLRNL